MISYRLRRTFILGVRSLALHKLRSVLTALGIIFGVSSVIAMLSIGEGANYEAQLEIERLGSQNVILKTKKPSAIAGSRQEQAQVIAYGLTWKDFQRIDDSFDTIERMVPLRIFPDDGRYLQHKIDVNIIGTSPEYLDAANLLVARGRFLSQNDFETRRPVAVLGSLVATTLFKAVDPLGEYVKLGSVYFRVIGVLEPTGAASGTGGSQADDRNKDVYVPLSTAEARFGQVTIRITPGARISEKVELHQIVATIRADEEVPDTATGLRRVLRRFHQDEDYEVLVPLELLRQKERTKWIFNVVLGSIAAISLLVGGIGVMNIMLANITERTREIGVRRALGAKRRDIVTQFLVETVVLTTAGGLLGILLGVVVPYAVEMASGMKTIITTYSIVLSFGISALVGVVFGLYPARRAAALDPIEALRHE